MAENNQDFAAKVAARRAALLRDATKEKMAQTIEEMDRQCSEVVERIEALAHGADALLAPEARNFAPWRHAKLAKLLEMIRDAAAEVANDVNWGAEQVGCNHVEEMSHG